MKRILRSRKRISQGEVRFFYFKKLYLDYPELLEYNIKGFFEGREVYDLIGSI